MGIDDVITPCVQKSEIAPTSGVDPIIQTERCHDSD